MSKFFRCESLLKWPQVVVNVLFTCSLSTFPSGIALPSVSFLREWKSASRTGLAAGPLGSASAGVAGPFGPGSLHPEADHVHPRSSGSQTS